MSYVEPPIFWWKQVDEQRLRIAELEQRCAYLQAALDIQKPPDEDLVALLADLVEKYAPPDNPTVRRALESAQAQGWDPSDESEE